MGLNVTFQNQTVFRWIIKICKLFIGEIFIALLNLSALRFSFMFHDKAKRTQQGNLLPFWLGSWSWIQACLLRICKCHIWSWHFPTSQWIHLVINKMFHKPNFECASKSCYIRLVTFWNLCYICFESLEYHYHQVWKENRFFWMAR